MRVTSAIRLGLKLIAIYIFIGAMTIVLASFQSFMLWVRSGHGDDYQAEYLDVAILSMVIGAICLAAGRFVWKLASLFVSPKEIRLPRF